MSYIRSLYHLVFRTRNSATALTLEHSEELYRYIWGFCKKRKCVLLRINGMEDHLHLLFRLHPEIALSAFVHDLKIASGNWLRLHKNLSPPCFPDGRDRTPHSRIHMKNKSAFWRILQIRENITKQEPLQKNSGLFLKKIKSSSTKSIFSQNRPRERASPPETMWAVGHTLRRLSAGTRYNLRLSHGSPLRGHTVLRRFARLNLLRRLPLLLKFQNQSLTGTPRHPH